MVLCFKLDLEFNDSSVCHVFKDGAGDSYLRENDDGTDGLDRSAVAENVVGCSIFPIHA